MSLALRGLEGKTLDPYLAGWRRRVLPTLGHLPVRMITNGAVDRAVHGWIADDCGRSTSVRGLGRSRHLRRLHSRPHRRGLRSQSRRYRPTFMDLDRSPADDAEPRRNGGQRHKRPTSPHRTVDRGGPRAGGSTTRRGGLRLNSPAVHPAPRRADLNSGTPRCHALGRGRDPPWLRTSPTARPSAYRPHLDGRRRRTGPRTQKDRRPRVTDHNPAAPAPRRAVDLRCQAGAERPSHRPSAPT